MSGTEKKPQVEEKTEGAVFNLKVKGNDGEEFFKIKINTPLKKLMDTYCTKTSKSTDSVRFLTNGDRINPTDIPASLGLEDNDVMVEQAGGTIIFERI